MIISDYKSFVESATFLSKENLLDSPDFAITFFVEKGVKEKISEGIESEVKFIYSCKTIPIYENELHFMVNGSRFIVREK